MNNINKHSFWHIVTNTEFINLDGRNIVAVSGNLTVIAFDTQWTVALVW